MCNNDEKISTPTNAIFNIATELVATQSCNVAVAFFAQSKKLTQRERGRGRAQPYPDSASASTYATLVAVASQFLYRLYSIHTYVFHFLLLAESRMAPSTWSGATSRGWSSTTSPTSIRASTSAARRATSMARSVSPYPIRSRCKLWVSAVYSYVLCTCCCRGGGRGRQMKSTTKSQHHKI